MAPLVARLLCLLAAASVTAGFNLDTKHPVILQGPITNPDVERGHSYFGYSVGLTTAPNSGSWVLVGAPRANSTLGLHNVPNTGAMFKCSLELGKCEEVITDTTGNDATGQSSHKYHDYKQGAWIGGAMDANPAAGDKVAVCGHRWINQYREKDKYHYFVNGVCYWMDSDVSDYRAHKVVPLVDNTLQTQNERNDRNSSLYAYGQAGISVHFAKNGSELLLGAPGIYNWKGSVVRLSDSKDFRPGPNVRRRRQTDPSRDLSDHSVPNPFFTDAVQENDYFGYSVSSGEFFDNGETYYVAGAPRAALGKGKVFVFDLPPNNLEAIGVVLDRTGSQVGEYFGAAVLGLDVTGDGRPELLVGAPQYSLVTGTGALTGVEEGRVCVYKNLGKGKNLGNDQLSEEPDQVLTGSGSTRARFGSAVSSVGDLDMDGYNDIAVGAPYEDDQRGAIYIYLGSSRGFIHSYSQRILASELSPLLRGFGVSISHGLDMDANQYSDVAVGSYLSGEAVLLRAQPVLRFDAHLRTSTEKLQSTDSRFQVTACIKYFGNHLPDQMPTEVLMKIESRHVKCEFDLSGGSRDNFTYSKMLTYGISSCNHFDVLIKSDIHDYTQPIQLSMSYGISSKDASVTAHTHPVAPVVISTDISKRAQRQRRRRQASPLITGDLSEFCASCPVVNRLGEGQTQVRISVPFSIGCGADAICQSDLSVSASVRGLKDGDKFVVGASPTIVLDVNVTNVGEPASLPSVQVRLPQPLELVRVPEHCTERQKSDHVLLTCHILPHPFPPGADGGLKLKLGVKDLAAGMESLTVQLNVSSAGQELAAADNVYNFTLGLKAEADIAVTGQPLEEPPLYYDKKADRDESERNDPNYVIVSHRYQVLRDQDLPSPVEAVNISFLVPVNVTDASGREIRVVDVYRPAAAVDGRQLACSIETGYFLASDGNSFVEAPRTWRRNFQLTDEQRLLLPPIEYQFEGNATTVLNCAQPSFVSCVRIECGTVAFPRPNTNVVVTLSMRVKIHELEPYVGDRDSLVISTVGLADVGAVPYPLQPLDGRPDLYQVHSILLPSSLQPFPVWIIVVTVIGALLLLAAITYGLYKAGFFKRRRPEGV